ncbi:MAG: hypothetical protein MI919_35895, partial [Holophagales bacterium]|nr:hypothetical protein [Holophagales bacterium]
MPPTPPSAPGAESPSTGSTAPAAGGLATAPRSRPATSPAERLGRLLPWLIGLAAAVGLGLTFSARYLVDTDPLEQLELSGRVAVLPFAVDAPRGDDWASWGLAALVTEALETSEGVQVVPMRHLDRAFGGRDLRLDDASGRARARELVIALGAELVADITFRRRAEEVILDARFLGPAGEEVESRQIVGADPVAAADRLSLAMSAALAPTLAPVGFERAFTGDPFVDRLYAEGVHAWMSGAEDHEQAPSSSGGPATFPGSARGPADALPAGSRAQAARPYFEIALRHQPAFLRAKARLV